MWQAWEKESQSWEDWNEVEAGSRDKVKYIEINKQLLIATMKQVDKQEWRQVNSKGCEDAEQWWDCTSMNVGWQWAK